MSGSNGGFFDTLGTALSNPAFQGLLGLTAGFGQAAMPQPYKGGTPWGATLGMGAQGLGQGLQNAYKMKLEQNQAQGLDISNKAAASQLPLTLAKNKMLTDIWNNPSLIQSLIGGENAAAAPSVGPVLPVQRGATGTQSSGAPPMSMVPALSSISDPAARSAAVNAALKSGLPPSAWAPWIAAVHNESGWNLGEKDGSSGEIGPGQVMPETGKGMGFTPEQLRDPQTNLLASAKYFGQKWKESNGDPLGAFAGYNTGSVKGDAPQYVALAKARLGQWGGDQGAGVTPVADQSGALPAAPQQDAMASYQQYEQRARAASVKQMLGIPSGEDPAVLHATAQQYLKLALAGPTKQSEAQAQANVDLGTAGPIQLAKTLNTSIDLKPGGMAMIPNGSGGWTIGKNPELREVTGPTGEKTYVHINPASPFAPQGTPGESAPVLTPSGQTAVAAIPQQQQEGRNEAVKEFLGPEQNEYQAAQNTQAWLNQIDHAAQTMNKAGPAYMTGPFAPERYALMSGANDLGRTLGIDPKHLFDQNAVANWEEMKKSTTTAGFELSSHYEGHAKQAAQTIQNATSAIAGEKNSPEGVMLVSGGIREGAQSAIDSHEYKQMVNDATKGAGLEHAVTDFYKAHPAEQYTERAVSRLTPVTIKDPKKLNNYLPGTFVTDGKTIDQATGKPKIVQIPERVDTIGGIQFPLKIPTYIQGGANGGG